MPGEKRLRMLTASLNGVVRIEGDRLYALYHLATYFRLRRSELVGLCWSDVDLAARRIHVRQPQVDDELDSAKSEDCDRIVTIDPDTADVLRAGQPKVISETLGHSTVAFTMDVYTEVAARTRRGRGAGDRRVHPWRAKNVPNGGQMITKTHPGLRVATRNPRPNAEDRGFEPRRAVKPNRISSAAP
jgi:integrase